MKSNRSKSKSQWADHFTRRAKKQRYPARSVYKLEEIQKKFSLIKRGNAVLDLGCSPGSWLKYSAGLTGAEGTVVGIDLNPVEIDLPKQVRTIQGDMLGEDVALLKTFNLSFDIILSDMAPSTTGMKGVDAARSMELCEAALSISKDLLKTGGHFVCKIFQGEDFKSFANTVRQRFLSQKIFKPQSSRKNSKEIYIIGIGKK